MVLPMRLAALACLSLAVAFPADANDGFGGFSATGLTFGQTDKVTMEEEDLFISIDTIRVAYLFRNAGAEDVTGEVIFPMPPISLEDQLYVPLNLPEDLGRENLIDFTATVDGRAVPVAVDRIAVVTGPQESDYAGSAQYDTPGRDVTAEVGRFGVPITPDLSAVLAALTALGPDALAELETLGLVRVEDGGDGLREIAPLWSVVLRYHWTQTFPAGAAVRIAHEYQNLPAGGLFNWSHPPREDYQKEFAAEYCIDEGTSRGMARVVTTPSGESGVGMMYALSYVLRTANSWAGPIGKFRLTIDKGDPAGVVSLCASGITKTGPTTFVMEKSNYTPESDLAIMVLHPMPQQ
jgi:hypothetical protein